MTLYPPSPVPPEPAAAPPPGRIDVHSHLLPGIDDGCRTVMESIECARRMVGAGYTHSFCTPHVWPNLPENNIAEIRRRTTDLQSALDAAGVPLRLMPGGEINLVPGVIRTDPQAVVSYGMNRRYVLADIWADRLPDFFWPTVRWFRSIGMTLVLAHPERMKAVQDEPGLADAFAERGVLLQGNLQCFSDPPGSATYRVATQYLREGRYFLLGCDLHRIETLGVRLDGLKHAIELGGEKLVSELTVTNPRKLFEARPTGDAT